MANQPGSPNDDASGEAAYLHDRAADSTPFVDDEDLEPLSFVPGRLRRNSLPPGAPSDRPGSIRPPPSDLLGAASLFSSSHRDSSPPPTGRPGSLVPPPPSQRRGSILPPPSGRTGSILPPPSGRELASDFEVISSRFRQPWSPAPAEPDVDVAWVVLQQSIGEASADLRRRAFLSSSEQEQARFVGHAESLDKLLTNPLSAEYLLQPGVPAGLLKQLSRLKSAQRAWPDEREYRDILLKATVTSIHLAPCLGYWQSNADVPPHVKRLMTPERVYGSALEISKTRKSRQVDHFIARYTAVVSDLARIPTLNLEVRKPIIWPWCRFAIEKVAYTFRPSTERARERGIEEAITDVKLLQVLFNVFLDDAADNVQDPALVQLLGEIPSAGGAFGIATPEVYRALRLRLGAIGREEFTGYFDLAVEVWCYTLEKLRELAGASFTALAPELADDYARIVASMQLSVDLNSRPLEVFRLDPGELERRYGARDVGEALAHNSNRLGFYTVDRMVMRAQDPERHARLEGSLPAYRRLALLFQEMHQIGNSVATGAREAGSDDMSNELFKLANDRLNTTDGWALPDELRAALGPAQEDALLRAFARKKDLRRRREQAPPGSREHEDAQRAYLQLSDGIEELIEVSGCQTGYFESWLERRAAAATLIGQMDIPDGASLLAGNDLLLVLHLIYKGKI